MKNLTKLITTFGLSFIFSNQVFPQQSPIDKGKYGTYNTEKTYYDKNGKARIKNYSNISDETNGILNRATGNNSNDINWNKTANDVMVVGGTLLILNELFKPRNTNYSPPVNYSEVINEENEINREQLSKPEPEKILEKKVEKPFWKENGELIFDNEKQEFIFGNEKEELIFGNDYIDRVINNPEILLDGKTKEAEEYFSTFERDCEWCESLTNETAREACKKNVSRKYNATYEKLVKWGAYEMMKSKLGPLNKPFMDGIKSLDEWYKKGN